MTKGYDAEKLAEEFASISQPLLLAARAITIDYLGQNRRGEANRGENQRAKCGSHVRGMHALIRGNLISVESHFKGAAACSVGRGRRFYANRISLAES